MVRFECETRLVGQRLDDWCRTVGNYYHVHDEFAFELSARAVGESMMNGRAHLISSLVFCLSDESRRIGGFCSPVQNLDFYDDWRFEGG